MNKRDEFLTGGMRYRVGNKIFGSNTSTPKQWAKESPYTQTKASLFELPAQEDVCACLSMSACIYVCGCELKITINTANEKRNSLDFFLSFSTENL